MELKTKVSIGFSFGHQDTIEGVITLRIDSCKEENFQGF
jgi:hypothetical protein